MIIDVRSREEYVKGHIKGSLNIPLQDFEYYLDFLQGKTVKLYCSKENRAILAKEYLEEHGISSSVIPMTEYHNYEVTQHGLVCAINYLTVKPGLEEEFTELAKGLCRKTVKKKGFMGSKIFRISSISFGGSMVQGLYQEIPIQPTKFIMLTYWTTKEDHEKFHQDSDILESFGTLMPYLASMPFEEFGEIIR